MLASLRKRRIPETWFHYLWKQQVFSGFELVTEEGQLLTIDFPGWYNRAWGPDFRDARLKIGDELRFGDVEIHLNEAAWYQHRHHEDDAYNKVVLHVFLNPCQQMIKNGLGQVVPSLCLLSGKMEAFWKRIETRPDIKINESPGACGLLLDSEKSQKKLRSIICQAAEERIITKSLRFETSMRSLPDKSYDNALFKGICRSLGYSGHSEWFEKLAEQFPYSASRIYFGALHRGSRLELLSRWFGYLNLLQTIESDEVHDTLRRDWKAFNQHWKNLGLKECPDVQPLACPNRPANNPVRRLTGLFYHLEKTSFQGLFKEWLAFFVRLAPQGKHPHYTSREILVELDRMFPQPEWDPLSTLFQATSQTSLIKPVRFIGKERQLVILVNAVIPFFIAWARLNGDRNLEKCLLGLFLTLPPEGENHKTRFMKNRLFKGNKNRKIRQNLNIHQGLIQLYDDCCTNFYEGCRNCTFLKLLRKPQ